MNCWNCGVPLDPTVAYCTACGVPHEPTQEEYELSGAAREERSQLKKTVEWARDKLVLALFLLIAVVISRVVLLRPRAHDYHVGYRLPFALVEAKKIDPPQMVEIKPLPLPLPVYDPHDLGGLDEAKRKKEQAERERKKGK
ncbi:MAG: hypothetical protein AB7N76_31860 [Planctomycetota bacterium]